MCVYDFCLQGVLYFLLLLRVVFLSYYLISEAAPSWFLFGSHHWGSAVFTSLTSLIESNMIEINKIMHRVWLLLALSPNSCLVM